MAIILADAALQLALERRRLSEVYSSAYAGCGPQLTCRCIGPLQMGQPG